LLVVQLPNILKNNPENQQQQQVKHFVRVIKKQNCKNFFNEINYENKEGLALLSQPSKVVLLFAQL
jgi:hypothetical protein